jgi:hypothetical protein
VRTCTKCGASKPVGDFRRIDARRRHTWCGDCERKSSNERAARSRYPAGRLVHDCDVVADNLEHLLAHYGGSLDNLDTEILVDARDALRRTKARLAEAGAA